MDTTPGPRDGPAWLGLRGTTAAGLWHTALGSPRLATMPTPLHEPPPDHTTSRVPGERCAGALCPASRTPKGRGPGHVCSPVCGSAGTPDSRGLEGATPRDGHLPRRGPRQHDAPCVQRRPAPGASLPQCRPPWKKCLAQRPCPARRRTTARTGKRRGRRTGHDGGPG